MAVNKPSIPKGTRDFTPVEMVKRNYIFDTIKSVFKTYGFLPIETPAMENLSTLLGKYGDEGDKLLFKILNSGGYLSKAPDEIINKDSETDLAKYICERGLRYDLTVPFARFVVQHRNELTFPFKRYQIQPVWRADKPQKGRYREFYQCDVDMIGSNSLLNEVELIQIMDQVFSKLDLDVTIKMNNRKILAGIADAIGQPEKFMDITIAIDKLDKIGIEKVLDELRSKGLGEPTVEKLHPFLRIEGTANDKLSKLSDLFSESETGTKGIEEIKYVFKYLSDYNLKTILELDLTLARGLNYYTGAIFEVKSNEMTIGSICGGGRYDDLTGVFGLNDVSGVGISFGADRIYDVLEQTDKFPKDIVASTKVFFVNFGEKEVAYCLPLAQRLREEGISTEVYPDSAKMKKQMGYANAKSIPFVILVGEDEMNSGVLTLKNMNSGEQQKLRLEDILKIVKGDA